MDVGARAATGDDLELLVKLATQARDSLRKERGGPALLEQELAALAGPVSELREILRSYLQPGRDHLVVMGEVDAVAVGFALVRLDELALGLVATVEAVYVETGARGVGVGEALLFEAARLVGDRGAAALDAYALPGMRELKNFFESAGFVARLLTMRRLPQR